MDESSYLKLRENLELLVEAKRKEYDEKLRESRERGFDLTSALTAICLSYVKGVNDSLKLIADEYGFKYSEIEHKLEDTSLFERKKL